MKTMTPTQITTLQDTIIESDDIVEKDYNSASYVMPGTVVKKVQHYVDNKNIDCCKDTATPLNMI